MYNNVDYAFIIGVSIFVCIAVGIVVKILRSSKSLTYANPSSSGSRRQEKPNQAGKNLNDKNHNATYMELFASKLVRSLVVFAFKICAT